MPDVLPNKPGRPGPQAPGKSGPHHPVPRAGANVPRSSSPVGENLEDCLVEPQNQDARSDRTRPTELVPPKSTVINDEDNIQSGTIDERHGPKLMSKTQFSSLTQTFLRFFRKGKYRLVHGYRRLGPWDYQRKY
jgi:hypothetical protein